MLSTDVGIIFTAHDRSRAGISSFNRSLGTTTRTVSSLGRSLLAITGIGGGMYMLGNIMRSGVTEAAAFERQMANVSTMLNEQSMQLLPQYTQQLRAMSVQFGEGTETLSKGLYDILSASIAPAKALDVLAVSTKAAKAGITDTGVAADAITTILNSYSLSAEQASAISDKLFSIVIRGKTTFAELAPNIGKIAAIAATAGVSLDDLGATLATMTRAGVQTEIAITSLRAIILSFLKPQTDSIQAARQYGIELNSQTLRTIGLTGVIQKLKQATAEELAVIVPTSRAITGFAAAVQKAESLAGDYDFMLNSLGNTETAYQKIAGNSAFKLDQMNQQWIELKRTIGDEVVPVLTSVFELLNNNKSVIQRYSRDLKEGAGMLANVLPPYVLYKYMESRKATAATKQKGPRITDQAAWQRYLDFQETHKAGQLEISESAMAKIEAMNRYTQAKPTGQGTIEEQIAADKRMEQLRRQVAEEIQLTGRLNEPRQHAKMMIDFQAEAAARYGENTQKAKEATKQFEQQLRQLEKAQSLARIADDIGNAFSTAFEDAILNAKNLQEVLQALANSIQRAFFQEMVSKPLGQFFASFAGNMMGAGTTATVAHGEGRVGSIGARRLVDSSVFDNAPKFHDLKPGETAIIAQDDEVISRPGRRISGGEKQTINNNFYMQMIDGSGAREFFNQYSAQVSYAQTKELRNNRGRRGRR